MKSKKSSELNRPEVKRASVGVLPQEFEPFKELQELLPPPAASDRELLKKQIQVTGRIEIPIVTTPDGRIIDGHTRVSIGNELGITDIPRVVKDVPDKEAIKLGIALNVARRHLSYEQKTEIIKKLRDEKFTQEEIAATLGVSQQNISDIEKKDKKGSNTESGNASPGDLRYKIKPAHEEKIVTRARAREPLPQIAADYGITVRRLRQIMDKQKEKGNSGKPKERPAPKKTDGKFGVILANPEYPNKSKKSAQGKQNCRWPRTLKKICDLKIPAADDAVLFLRTPNGNLGDAFQILKAWAFIYRAGIFWTTNDFDTGEYVCGENELLLIAVKGNPGCPEKENRPASTLTAPADQGKDTPDDVYNLIGKMYPGRRYLEVFAQKERDGWISWDGEENGPKQNDKGK